VSVRSQDRIGALVIGSDYKSLGVVRSLGRRGIPVWVLGDDHLIASWSRYTKRRLPWPTAGEAHMVGYLLDLGRKHGLDGWAIYPTDDETAGLLARHRKALAERFRLSILVSWETLRWACDKRLTYRLAADLGVDHPRTFYPRSREDVTTFDGEYPAIIKPAIPVMPAGIMLPKAWPVADPKALLARYDEVSTLIDPDLIMVQELIPGGGDCQLSYAALCREGRPIASLVARRTRQWPMDFGRASTYVETVEAPDIEEKARSLLEALRFEGLVEVEFKRDPRDHRAKLLDINPRVWGWHTLGARAGVDFSYLLWQMLSGVAIPELRGQAGVRWVRGLTDLPVSLAEIWAGRLAISTYISSLRGPIEFAILAADDPLPALLEVPASIYLALKRRHIAARARTTNHGDEPVETVASGNCASR
jgi:predicted ATP-grasp superfamily ATP-dependent carboligase